MTRKRRFIEYNIISVSFYPFSMILDECNRNLKIHINLLSLAARNHVKHIW